MIHLGEEGQRRKANESQIGLAGTCAPHHIEIRDAKMETRLFDLKMRVRYSLSSKCDGPDSDDHGDELDAWM